MWYAFRVAACAVTLFCAPTMALAVTGSPVEPGIHATRSDLREDITSMGDPSMAPLMDAWLSALRSRQHGLRKGSPWTYPSDDVVFGALMFELADMAPLAREPLPTELAPYAHQFAGDMMKSPLLVRVAGTDDHPAYIAVNRRPGAPLPTHVSAFIAFALSEEGQGIVGRDGRFPRLSPTALAVERLKLEGFVAKLGPALPVYRVGEAVRGPIRSVGSDGMKSLMERWMRDFRKLQPGVLHGDRWEHLGTLNGFHALMVGETDIAPMGRELWPEEAAAYAKAHPGQALLEIRVARGGFNTPQRTTAQAIFVHESNPITRISVPQLAAILNAAPKIMRWGELGLTGEWAQRPITVYIPPKAAPNTRSMQATLLDGREWNPAAREGTIASTAAAIAQDPNAIGFGGYEEGGPGLKTLAVAAQDGGPYVEGTGETVSSGRYPLTRYLYIRVARPPGQPLRPQVREFLRYVLSRAAQEPILYSGYFPLTAAEARQELAKLR
jgi:ABC-type phosphate transport system substrate-binding protein